MSQRVCNRLFNMHAACILSLSELTMQDVTSRLVVTAWQKSMTHSDRNIGSIAFSILPYLSDRVGL